MIVFLKMSLFMKNLKQKVSIPRVIKAKTGELISSEESDIFQLSIKGRSLLRGRVH